MKTRKVALSAKIISPKDAEHASFVRQISDYLDDARKNGSFHQLVVIAAPSFLGLLREILPSAIQGLIQKEVNKDVVRLSTSEILDQI